MKVLLVDPSYIYLYCYTSYTVIVQHHFFQDPPHESLETLQAPKLMDFMKGTTTLGFVLLGELVGCETDPFLW